MPISFDDRDRSEFQCTSGEILWGNMHRIVEASQLGTQQRGVVNAPGVSPFRVKAKTGRWVVHRIAGFQDLETEEDYTTGFLAVHESMLPQRLLTEVKVFEGYVLTQNEQAEGIHHDHVRQRIVQINRYSFHGEEQTVNGWSDEETGLLSDSLLLIDRQAFQHVVSTLRTQKRAIKSRLENPRTCIGKLSNGNDSVGVLLKSEPGQDFQSGWIRYEAGSEAMIGFMWDNSYSLEVLCNEGRVEVVGAPVARADGNGGDSDNDDDGGEGGDDEVDDATDNGEETRNNGEGTSTNTSPLKRKRDQEESSGASSSANPSKKISADRPSPDLKANKSMDLADTILCSICCDTIFFPTIILPCAHTYCRTCITGYIESKKMYGWPDPKIHLNNQCTCPDCRTVVKELKPNFALGPVAMIAARKHKTPDEIEQMTNEAEKIDMSLYRLPLGGNAGGGGAPILDYDSDGGDYDDDDDEEEEDPDELLCVECPEHTQHANRQGLRYTCTGADPTARAHIASEFQKRKTFLPFGPQCRYCGLAKYYYGNHSEASGRHPTRITSHAPPSVTLTTSFETKLAHSRLLVNETGKDAAIVSLQQAINDAGCDQILVKEVSLENMAQVIERIHAEMLNSPERDWVVFQLCDGTEEDGYPGVTIPILLEKMGIAFTGASSEFYNVTTAKPDLKRLLIEYGVPTSPFVEVFPGHELEAVNKAAVEVGWPMFVKPSVSYASLTISEKSIVRNQDEALTQIEHVQSQTTHTVFLEKFLPGREFTALVTGGTGLKGCKVVAAKIRSSDDEPSREVSDVYVYPVAERVFHPELLGDQRILAFDRYFNGYTVDGAPQANPATDLFHYELAPAEFQAELQHIAGKAFVACGGTGYGRVDMRTMTLDDSAAMVLE
ncbi:hypothetical protein HDU76_005043, partial [Blyttiomyces sp. JEL0837]